MNSDNQIQDQSIVANPKTADVLRKVGKLSIYEDPFLADGQILVGRKGESCLSTGYVYAPYIPLSVVPTVLPAILNSPLEDLVEGVFKEEIESGELTMSRSKDKLRPVIDVDEFSLRKGISSRKKINSQFYGKISIENL